MGSTSAAVASASETSVAFGGDADDGEPTEGESADPDEADASDETTSTRASSSDSGDADEALLRNVPEPDPFFHPVDLGGPWLYTQVPTDYRLQSLFTYVARASALGAWVEATATPREVVFELNDTGRLVGSSGAVVSSVTCPALGSIAPYDADNPGACSLTFLDSSSISGDSDFDYELRIEWDVVFTGAGIAGPLPPPSTITTFTTGESVRVGEARPST